MASVGGVFSSGQSQDIDFKALLEQIGKAQQMRLLPLENQADSVNAKISAFGSLATSLSSLQDALQALQNPDSFGHMKVDGDFDAFKVTTHAGAPQGSFNIEVDQLAQANSIATGEVSDADAKLGSGTLEFTVGGKTVKLDLKNASLKDVQDTLNKATDADGNPLKLSASVVQVKDGQSRLMINATESGVDNAVSSIKFTPSDQSSSALSKVFSDQQEINQAKNAKLKINGLAIEQSTNHISNAIKGIDIDLVATSAGKNQQFSLNPDTESSVKAIKKVVDAYNKFLDLSNKATAFDKDDSSKNGILLSDSTLSQLKNNLRNALMADPDVGSLEDVGIKIDLTGKLAIDNDKLTKALANDFQGTFEKFVGKDQKGGIWGNLNSKVSEALDKTNGTFKKAEDSLNKQLDQIGKKEDQMNEMITSTMDMYQKQFAALNDLMSKMNSLSDVLSMQFDSKSK